MNMSLFQLHFIFRHKNPKTGEYEVRLALWNFLKTNFRILSCLWLQVRVDFGDNVVGFEVNYVSDFHIFPSNQNCTLWPMIQLLL